MVRKHNASTRRRHPRIPEILISRFWYANRHFISIFADWVGEGEGGVGATTTTATEEFLAEARPVIQRTQGLNIPFGKPLTSTS